MMQMIKNYVGPAPFSGTIHYTYGCHLSYIHILKMIMINSKNKSHFVMFFDSLDQLIIVLVKYSIKLYEN